MHLRIDPNSGVPLGLQIARAIRLAIAQGRVVPGEHLPSARDMAAQLQVNFHTVRKAYGELQAEGLLEFQRGKGTYVAQTRRRLQGTDLASLVAEHLGRLIEDLAGSDVSAADLKAMVCERIDSVMKQPEEPRP